MAVNGALETFLKRARQRYLANLALDQTAVAAGVAMCAASLLLVLGTQILNWYWPVLLFVAGLGLGIYRIRQMTPTTYALAQKIDNRLGSFDVLSTAYYFTQDGAGRAADLIELQKSNADRIAVETDIAYAVPLHLPKSAYVFAGLFAIAASLFAFRYGIMRTMDLSAPIANIQFHNPFTTDTSRMASAAKKSVIQEQFDEQLKQLGISMEDLNSPAGEQKLATEKPQSALATPDGQIHMESNEQGQSVENGKGKEGDPEGPEEGSDNSAPGKAKEAGDKENGEGASTQQGAPQQGKQQTPASASKNPNGESASLADKVRDAMQNLLSKLKTPGKQSESQQSAAAQNDKAKQKPDAGQKGMQGQGKSQGEGQPNPDQQSDQDGEAGDQSAQSKGGDKNSASQQDAKSGVGKQDGDKELRDAEQLAAMGKISELLGKRAAQVTGEMTVEVPSGKQQLKTAYSQKKALHADAGSEANRDEIPLIYQPYVQRYFEEVRKVPGKTKN